MSIPIKGKFLKKKLIPAPTGADLANSIGGIAEIASNLNKLQNEVVDTVNSKLEEVDTKVQGHLENLVDATKILRQTQSDVIDYIKEVKVGPAGKDADEEKIIKSVAFKVAQPVDENQLLGKFLSHVPRVDTEKLSKEILSQIPKIDEQSLLKKMFKILPENKTVLKIVREQIESDPMSVIEKIMALPPEKFKIKSSQIDGLQQTISAFHNQLNRGYLHGGGDTVVAGTNVTITTNANGNKVISASGGSTGITIGTTTIASGSSGRVLYDNAGVVGEMTTTGSGTVLALATSPVLVTPALGVATATSINGVVISGSSTPTLAVTGTTTVSGANTGDQNLFGSIIVSGQTTVTPASTTQALTLVAGTNVTITTDNTAKTITINSSGGASGITIGTTTITSGTNTRILYNNSGVVGEYTLSGSGTVVAMQTSPSLITPALGVATATSLAIGGATIGTNGLAITGHVLVEGVTSTGATGTGKFVFDNTPTLITPVLGAATATSINGLTITSSTGTLTITSGKTLTTLKTLSFTAADDTGVYTLPTGTATLVATTVTSLSSLVTVGTLTGGATGAGFTVALGTSTITGILGSANGGTGNGFTKFSGPATAEKTFTLPNASATILTDNALVTLAQGGTATNLTASNGGIVYSTASALAILAGTATARKVLLSQSSTAPIWSTETYATPGTSGNVMTSDGTNWTSAAPAAASAPLVVPWVTIFETSGRFTTTLVSGTATFGTSGLNLDTTATGNRSASVVGVVGFPGSQNMAANCTFTCNCYDSPNGNASDAGVWFVGIGAVTVAGSGITFTTRHIGFKRVASSGTVTLVGTQSDGTTEATTATLATLSNGGDNNLELIFVTTSTQTTFYVRNNGGSQSAGVILNTHFPNSGMTQQAQFAVSNSNSAFDTNLICGSASWHR